MSFSNDTFILKNDGTLWGCGRNDYSLLGLGNTSRKTIFTQITTNADNIKSVYCGENHTIILKNDGTLWGCGNNVNGQLGLGDTSNRATFTQITTNIDDIKSVYCGYNCTFILKNDGTLWSCGTNSYGELGLGDTTSRNTFTKAINNVKSVDCGYGHTLILKNDNTLWGCGRNNYYQLGLGDANNRTTFTQITNNVKSAYCGGSHTIILKNDNTLWGCGYNGDNRLGLEDTITKKTLTQVITNTDNIKSVYCGRCHTFILKNDGTLWGCGDNQYGELGLGDTTNRSIFTIIGINTNDIELIYCGNYYTLILKNDGTLWGCGLSDYGQLGLGDISSESTFTQVTTNTNDIKCFANDYSVPSTIRIYDTKIGYAETLDANNFRNISVNSVERLKSLCINPLNTHLNCLISFDKKQTWKTFDGLNWNTISDISPENIIVNGMALQDVNQLDKSKLISGGFTGDLDFKIAMKTNNVNKTPSVTKIYIEYK